MVRTHCERPPAMPDNKFLVVYRLPVTSLKWREQVAHHIGPLVTMRVHKKKFSYVEMSKKYLALNNSSAPKHYC